MILAEHIQRIEAIDRPQPDDEACSAIAIAAPNDACRAGRVGELVAAWRSASDRAGRPIVAIVDACWLSTLTAQRVEPWAAARRVSERWAHLLGVAASICAPLLILDAGVYCPDAAPLSAADAAILLDALRTVRFEAAAWGVSIGLDLGDALHATPDSAADYVDAVNSPAVGWCVRHDADRPLEDALRWLRALDRDIAGIRIVGRGDPRRAAADARLHAMLAQHGYDGLIVFDADRRGDGARRADG